MNTTKKLNVKVIVQKNPNVDLEKLEQGLQALKELAKSGVKPSSYSLETPESGKAMHRFEGTRLYRKSAAHRG